MYKRCKAAKGAWPVELVGLVQPEIKVRTWASTSIMLINVYGRIFSWDTCT